LSTIVMLGRVDGLPQDVAFGIPKISLSVIHGWSVAVGPTMLTHMTEEDWEIAVEVFRALRRKLGESGHDDRKFLEALH
jgi:hypothetical protein